MSSLRFENVGHLWLWLLLVALGAGMLYVTYRRIFERSQRRIVWWLMALRGAGLLLLLLALAKPTWTQRTEVVDAGRLAVILDDSLSMSLAGPEGESRYSLARKGVTELRQALQENRKGGEPTVEVDLFDINGEPVADAGPEVPRKERTDLLHAVSQVTARLRSKPMVGIALVTDGMDNTGRDDLLNLAGSAVPIYAIGFREDPEAARLDLAVERVQAPERAIVHNDVKVSVRVRKSAGPEIKAEVSIKRGAEELAKSSVSFGEGEAEQRTDLMLTPGEAGSFVYTASVSTAAGELIAANNAEHFAVQVDAEPIRVLYAEGFLRNEYKFVRRRLDDDPDIALVSVVRRGNPDEGPSQARDGLLSVERLEDLDVVILGDMESDYLSEAELAALANWVEAGHALIVLGGYHSFGPAGLQATPLADVLPVVFQQKEPHQSEEPFAIKLTEAGRRHPIFQVTGDRVKDEAMWSALPHLLGSCVVSHAKPAAEVLAVNPAAIGDEGPLPVVVVHRYGSGHAMVIAVDTTWRWSRLVRALGQSDNLFARFWSQAIRWMSGREAAVERVPIALSTDRPDYEVGKPVTIRVAREPDLEGDANAGEISVELTRETGEVVPVEMQAGSAAPDVFAGTYYPEAGGRYQVAASLISGGQVTANQATEFLVHGSTLELSDTRTNRAQLQAIADATGGVYVDAAEAASLHSRIDRRERRTPFVRRAELWNSPILFLLFLVVITAEWVIRRRNHLV